jgi:hypothetical protein
MPKDHQLRDAHWITVLNDNETFGGLDGCWIATVPEDAEFEEVDELDLTRFSVRELLDWAIDHGFFEAHHGEFVPAEFEPNDE